MPGSQTSPSNRVADWLGAQVKSLRKAGELALPLVGAAIVFAVTSAVTEQEIRVWYGALFIGLVVAQLGLCGLFAAYEATLALLNPPAAPRAALA